MLGYQCDDNGYLIYTFTPQLDVLLTQANCGTPHYLIPKNATLKAPPVDVEFKIARLVNENWIYEDDFRGCIIYCGDDSMQVTTIGKIPYGWSLEYDLQIKLRMDRDAVKKRIKRKIETATVTVDGYIFDVNVNSLTMMSVMIHSHELSRSETIDCWVMADNQFVKDLPLTTLKNALILGGKYLTDTYKEYEFI